MRYLIVALFFAGLAAFFAYQIDYNHSTFPSFFVLVDGLLAGINFERFMGSLK